MNIDTKEAAIDAFNNIITERIERDTDEKFAGGMYDLAIAVRENMAGKNDDEVIDLIYSVLWELMDCMLARKNDERILKRYTIIAAQKDTIDIEASDETEAKNIARSIFLREKRKSYSIDELHIQSSDQLYRVEYVRKVPAVWVEPRTEQEIRELFWSYVIEEGLYDPKYRHGLYRKQGGELDYDEWYKQWRDPIPEWFTLKEIEHNWAIKIGVAEDDGDNII